MASIFGYHIPGTKRVAPTKEAGTSGIAVTGGFVEDNEKNPKLSSASERFRTASDILANISIVAASLRYFLNLLSHPRWFARPADDSPEAKELAEFVEEVMDSLDISWTRVIRRAGMYKFHGFGIHEWTAIKRPDGKIGFASVDHRPQATIERWEVDDTGRVIGVWQRSPKTGEELPIPRWKFIYLLDDTLTDSPEGMGWFRHLVEPAERLKQYLNLEKLGFERDLSGIPVGKAPITAINRAVRAGSLSKEEGETLLNGIKDMVKMQVKQKDTGLVLDSQPYETQTSDGSAISSVAQWGIELLTGDPGSIKELGEAIERLNREMARVIGTENIFTGSEGFGSMALSKDKSSNLYLHVSSTLDEMVEQFTLDLIKPLWALNGFDAKLMPKLSHEEVAFKDVEQIAVVLKDLATAGAVLAPDDPAIIELREMLGISIPDLQDAIEDASLLEPEQGLEDEPLEGREEMAGENSGNNSERPERR